MTPIGSSPPSSQLRIVAGWPTLCTADYLAQYDEFLRLLGERAEAETAKAKAARNKDFKGVKLTDLRRKDRDTP